MVALTPLWESESLNTTYFQFKADNSTEINAFDPTVSQISWSNMLNISKLTIAYLNYTQNDSAEIDIYVKVPQNEPQGSKSSTIIMEAEYSG